MKKVCLLIFVSLVLLLAFASCDMLPDSITGIIGGGEDEHEHEWTEATCLAPKTCTVCGEREGLPLAHDWTDATCTEAKICKNCSTAWGEPLGHTWSVPTCTSPKTCRRCEVTDGDAPGHDWTEANCTTPKTCKVCTVTEGDPRGHQYVQSIVEPTCTDGGYTSNKCLACDDVLTTDHVTALGHLDDIVLEAKAATCTEDGLEAGVQCSRCGTITVKQSVVYATGHKISQIDSKDPTCVDEGYVLTACSNCGEEHKEIIPALGHDYGSAKCDENATCARCGHDSGAPIGHDFAEATCTEPKSCKREGCDATEGEPLGHDMAEGSCLAPSTCKNGCGYTEGEKDAHVLTQGIVTVNGVSVVQYSCSMCGTSFKLESTYYLDGSSYDGMTPGDNANRGYITSDEMKDMPVIATDENGNKYYELIMAAPKPGTPPQNQIWIPKEDKVKGDFSSANASVGFLSFKLNSYMNSGITMQLVDGSAGGQRWSADWCITEKVFTISAPTENSEGRSIVSVTGWGGLELISFDITDKENKFTGWFDVIIGLVLDPVTDTISAYYYVNGEYKGYDVKVLTTTTNAINSVYFSGNSDVVGSGIMFDDLTFGFTKSGAWLFDEHVHTWTKGNTTAPTCASDGYTTYTCECGVSARYDLESAIGHLNDVKLDAVAPTCTKEGLSEGVLCSRCNQETKPQKVIPALGHIEENVDETKPTCTEPGHTSGKVCSVCGEYTSEMEIIPALGHSFETTGTKPTCTSFGIANHLCAVCGYEYSEMLPALGHDYGEAKCDEAATCATCGKHSGGAIGHDYADATCTEPKTCQRTDCGATSGLPLGHKMQEATCSAPSTCERCDHTEGKRLPHTVELKYERNKIVYYCSGCDISYVAENGYYIDGSNHSGIVGTANNKNNGYTTNGGNDPAIVDGHYELINNGKGGQLEIWIPHSDPTKSLGGFSCDNNAVGFFSFKINSYMDSNIGMRFVDLNSTGSRWSSEWCIMDHFFQISVPKNGTADLIGWNKTVLKTVEVDDNNFTGWIDVKIGIELSSETDQITLHYLIDGQHVVSISKEMTILTNAIANVYISGTTSTVGSGIMLDDISFAYTKDGDWIFDTCDHDWREATCYDAKVCKICNYIGGPALGHTGGTASCDELAKCERCGVEYGDYKHNMTEASCYAAAVCLDCGKTVGDKLSHNPVADYKSGELKYICPMCERYYVVDNFYYLDGTDCKDMAGGANTGFAVQPDTTLPLITEDGYYSLLNNSGSLNKAEIWIPYGQFREENFKDFSTSTNAVGMLSFKISAYIDSGTDPLKIQLADTDVRAVQGANFWVDGALAGSIFTVTPPTTGSNGSYAIVKDWNDNVIAEIPVGKDMFTEWIDVSIAIVFDSKADTVTLHYYLNGAFHASITRDMTIITDKINAAYIYGKTSAVGSGIKLDNIGFGYSTNFAEVGIQGGKEGIEDVPGTDTPGEDDGKPTITDIDVSLVQSETLKTLVTNKIKQWDQSDGHNVHTGKPRYVLVEKNGEQVEALYFSRKTAWDGTETEQFSEFRFAVNGEKPGPKVTRFSFDYLINGTVEENQQFTFWDPYTDNGDGTYGTFFQTDAYVQIKTILDYPHGSSSDYYPELTGTDLILDGKWHTMSYEFANPEEIIDILLNLYHFQGELLIANLVIEYEA